MNDPLDRVAGAPITWGVCEVAGWGHQIGRERVLSEMAQLGLGATELGPDGYLPAEGDALRALLVSHGLTVVAGFVPLVLHREEALRAALGRAARAAGVLAGAGASIMVLAADTAESGYEAPAELAPSEWATLRRGVEQVTEVAAGCGLGVAFHPHAGTVIERPEDIRRLVETSPVPLCLDTGHLLVGGSDPVEIARAYADRVAHVHLKDVAAELAARVRARRLGYRDAVLAGMYRPLGRGDVDVAEVVRVLHRWGYRGWYVLEQDTVLDGEPEPGDGPIRDAAVSLDFVRGVVSSLNGQPDSSVERHGVAQGALPGGREGECSD